MTEDELIDGCLDAIEVLRPAIPFLQARNALVGAIANTGLSLIYQGLVTVKSERAKGTIESERALLAQAGNAALQELAKAHFEAMEKTQP